MVLLFYAILLSQSLGVISVETPAAIDYEENKSMRLIVAASADSKFAYTTVWVNLEDINDNDPIFSQERYITKFFEEEDSNTFVIQVGSKSFVMIF